MFSKSREGDDLFQQYLAIGRLSVKQFQTIGVTDTIELRDIANSL